MRDFAEHHESRQDFRVIKRFLTYVKPHIKTFIIAFFLMVLATFTGMILPLASGLAIDQMLSQDLTINDKIWLVVIGTLVLLIISAISTYLSYVQSLMLQKVGQVITHDIRLQVFKHIEQLSIGQLNQIPVGKLVTRTTNDPANISNFFTDTLVNVIRSFLSMIIIGGLLITIQPRMALLSFAVIPLILFASQIYRKFARNAYRQVRDSVSELNGYLSEHLSGMKLIQVFAQEKKKLAMFDQKNNKVMSYSMKETLTFSIYRPLLYLLSMTATLITLYIGVESVLSNVLTVGIFVSFYIYIGQFFEPIQQLSEQLNTIQGSFASAEKIFDVLDTQPDIQDDDEAIELTTFSGRIRFENVWFAYLEDEWVLKNVSFSLNPNENIAFVGATGSGKTTILQLLVRNYDIQKGEIYIDDIPIRHIKRSSLRKFIGQMLQDVFLFSGTIKENITLGNERIKDEAIDHAIDYVGLDYVLDKLPLRLQEKVKDRGKNFSSGERQLISFARALVYEPRLMILDEATANIDSETEVLIQQSLEKMMSISTMIIVAHRLSTIQHCDRIYVMQKGEIKEFGSHQDLLNQKGLYYHLYLLQVDQPST
jgi:ATP-binding cassette subfamily B protein